MNLYREGLYREIVAEIIGGSGYKVKFLEWEMISITPISQELAFAPGIYQVIEGIPTILKVDWRFHMRNEVTEKELADKIISIASVGKRSI